jgi:heat shock protein HtpX
MNFTKTAFLLLVLTAIFLAMGGAVGGQSGLVVAFLIALVMNGLSLWKSDKIVLRLHGAEEVDARSAPDLHGLIEALAARAGLPMPRVYLMHNPQPNAFATGRSPSSAAVCASTGLLELLSREEVGAVMAHELAHIKNRDTLTMTLAATIGSAISMVAQWLQVSAIFGRGRSAGGWLGSLLAMLVAPLAAMIVQMAISRSREYQADRLGAMICGNPLWLASALEKIQVHVRQVQNRTAEAVPATAHLFVINPLTGRGMDSLFSTHPSTENRIAELMKLAAEMGIAGSGTAGPPVLPDAPVRGRPRGAWG